MYKPWIFGVGLFGVAVLAAGCPKSSNNNANNNGNNSSATASATASAPPPKPKCESLDENCAATTKTKAQISGAEVVLTPPPGWIFAQQGTELLTMQKDGSAILVVSAFDAPADAKELNKTREAQLDALMKAAEITLVKAGAKKWIPKWDGKPDDTRKAGTAELKLFQNADVKRGDKKGVAVVLAGEVGGKKILAVGFAPGDDEKAPDDILKAIESLSAGTYE